MKAVANVPDWGRGSSPPPNQTYSDILTDAQFTMVMQSGHDPKDGQGFGVALHGGKWRTARSLVRFGLGLIEDDSGLYFNTAAGVAVTHENDWLRGEDGGA